MDKSYKCFYCKFDTGPIMTPEEKCKSCKYGSCFELKDRMTPCAMQDWLAHKELDKILDGQHEEVIIDSQREFAHRLLIVRPCYSTLPPHAESHELRRLRQLFREMLIEKFNEKKEKPT